MLQFPGRLMVTQPCTTLLAFLSLSSQTVRGTSEKDFTKIIISLFLSNLKQIDPL